MKNRKTGELIEIFGDFWLGMAGAAAQGLASFTEERRERKVKGDDEDFFAQASTAIIKVVNEAKAVADKANSDLKGGVPVEVGADISAATTNDPH